ncbi:DUF6588 family protein [Flammeovirgaceae bacterium SG7u.111]|nr:DUF6588 family protein [Flammeovirgaceae bacterium SG7u.132]WPO35501.1 DUF6588 family protein [Flammeovirgaceae bacterium SG7u.111]
MKHFHYIKVAFAFLLFSCSAVTTASAQDQLDVILEAGIEDAELLTKNYMKPFAKGFGYSINNGWFHTAKPHKTLGFDLIVTANVAMVPQRDQYFTFVNSEYNNILVAEGQSKELPTVFGPAEPGPELTVFDDNGDEVVRISSPQGSGLKDEIGYNVVPTPMVQLGLGIAKGTDIKIRYVPTIDYGDGDFSLIGFGVMHDVKQWIPGIKEMPFDLSAMIGYTKMTTTVNIDKDLDQTGSWVTKGLTFNGIISKKLSVFTFYGSLGFNTISTNIDVLGEYEINDETTLVDPLQLEFKNSSPKMTFGMNMKLGPLLFYGDYSVNDYSMLTAGLGFSIR